MSPLDRAQFFLNRHKRRLLFVQAQLDEARKKLSPIHRNYIHTLERKVCNAIDDVWHSQLYVKALTHKTLTSEQQQSQVDFVLKKGQTIVVTMPEWYAVEKELV